MSSKPETYFLGATIVTVGFSQTIAYLNSLKTNSFVLHELALGSLLIQWLAFIHASGILGNVRMEKYYDLTGSLTFISLILWSITSIPNVFSNNYGLVMNISLRQLIASSFVLIWACRLGSFLFSRSLRDGGIDSRFTEYKKNIYRFATCWTIQALWPFLCALPVFILNTIPSLSVSPLDTTALVYHDNTFINTVLSFLYQQQSQLSSLKITDYAGISLWLLGFLFEITADEQKRLFRLQHSKSKQHHSFIHTGVWSLSRHPNYFGEICVWSGIFLLCIGGYTYNNNHIASNTIWSWLNDWQSIIHILSAVLSPLFTFTLLVFVSGIPLLEQAGNKKWGEDGEYKAYKQNTPVLIPFIGRRGDAAF